MLFYVQSSVSAKAAAAAINIACFCHQPVRC